MILTTGIRHLQYLVNCFIRAPSHEEAEMNTQIVVDLTQTLGWIIIQKSELKSTQVFLFVSYEYHLESALLKPLKTDGSNFRT